MNHCLSCHCDFCLNGEPGQLPPAPGEESGPETPLDKAKRLRSEALALRLEADRKRQLACYYEGRRGRRKPINAESAA